MQQSKPRYFIAWRHNGENYWEAVSNEQVKALISKLVQNGVNPASIFISMGSMVNWMFPEYHKGCRQLWIDKIYDEINGTSAPSDYKGPDVSDVVVKKSPTNLYGWVSPDGRYFPCEYGGHSELARTIVGKLHKIDDARLYLENEGWLAIYRDPLSAGKYAVGMGRGKKISDEQLKRVQSIGLPTNVTGLEELL